MSGSKEETQEIATIFAKSLKSGGIFCLFGELGSGKTTFVQGVAKTLGVKEHITSPTFVILKQYKVNFTPPISGGARKQKMINLIHIDCYRLSKLEDAQGLGLEDIFENFENLVFIEWPERILDILPKKRINITFKHLGRDKRRITFK